MKVILILLFVFSFCLAKQSTVIVIGAGPSGIAAASKLHELNVDMLVLDAEPRIGGRVNSVHFENAIVELGAEWCQGEEGNVVYELVKNYSILGNTKFDTKLAVSDRDDAFSAELYEIFDNILEANEKPQDGITLGEHFIKQYNSSVRKRYANDEKKLGFAFEALEYFQHYIFSLLSAFSLFDTSALTDFEVCPGDPNLHWSGKGFKTIFDILMKKYPISDPSFQIENKIVLNQEVERISWSATGVIITCSDSRVYEADHLIFTPSLGVLKNKHNSLFWPRLPESKINAIRNIGIGAVIKILMHFPIRWWPSNFTDFSFMWKYYEREMVFIEFPHGPILNGRSWLLDMFEVYPVENNPNVLSVWFTGQMVPEIEKTPDSIVISGIMFALDKFLGHIYTLTNPDKILRTNWYSNPHFRGTYSYETIASRKLKPSGNLILGEPLLDTNHVPRVMFAGEATNPIHYSTVHGAIETGFREANIIAEYLKQKN